MIYTIAHDHITRSAIVSLMEFFTRFQIEKYGNYVSGLSSNYISRKIIQVPVQWAARDKWFEIYKSSSARKAMDPSIRELNPVEMQWILPRISFNLSSIAYDTTRRLQKTQQIPQTVNNNISINYAPGTYNIDLEVSVISKVIDDQFQLLEQILPYFSPSLSLDIKLYPDKQAESIPFVLAGVTPDIPVDLQENDERLIIFTYLFTVKLNYYLPKKLSGAGANGTVVLLGGSSNPTPDIGENDFFYLQNYLINGSLSGVPLSGSALSGTIFEPAVIWGKRNGIWSPIWTAPTSGAWIIRSGLPTSADLYYDEYGNPIIPKWTIGSGPPVSGAIPYNLYYFDISTGKVYRKYCEWNVIVPPPFYNEYPISNDYYYDSLNDKYYKKTCYWYLIHEGLSIYYRRIENIITKTHYRNNYIAITDSWIEEQQHIDRKFEEFAKIANSPNPFI